LPKRKLARQAATGMRSPRKKPSLVHNTFAELDHFAKTSVFIPIASAHAKIELHRMLRRMQSSGDVREA
jgi:hypothetical protein